MSETTDNIKNIDSAGFACAPGKNTIGGSCYDVVALVKIANAVNQSLLEECSGKSNNEQCLFKKISIPHISVIENNVEVQESILKQITTVLGNDCHACWLDHPKITLALNRDEKFYTFAPEYGQGGDWLDTNQIDNVMAQYEHVYPEFQYLDTVPLDFDKLPILKLHNFVPDSKKYPGKTKFASVINLDPHTMGGSHWVSIFVDTVKPSVYFFDSVGKRPPPEIEAMMVRIGNYFRKTHETVMKTQQLYRDRQQHQDIELNLWQGIDVRHNPIQHQYKNTECGVYSINFIVRSLKGETFDNIIQNKLSDAKVEKCRKKYFNYVVEKYKKNIK